MNQSGHINAALQARLDAGAQRTLEAVSCGRLILMEAPSSAYPRGMLALGKRVSNLKRRRPSMLPLMSSFFLSFRQAEAISPLANIKRPLRVATVLRALACVRRIRLKRPSIRVGGFPPHT